MESPAKMAALKNVLVQTLLWIAVCGYCVFTILAMFGYPVGGFDDAIPLVGGMLVNRGLTPNLDFYSVYTPLGLYVDGFAFNLLGRTVVAARLINASLYVLLMLVAIRFLRREIKGPAALIPVAALLFAAAAGGLATLPPWPAFAISLMAFLVYLYPSNSERNRLFALAGCGMLAAAALLYRINFGAYVAAAVTGDLLLRRRDFKAIAAFAIPMSVCVAGFYSFLYGAHTFAVAANLLKAGSHAVNVRFITFEFSAQLTAALMLPALWFCVRILTSKGGGCLSAFVAGACAIAIPVIAMLGRNHESIPYLLVAVELATVIFLQFLRPLGDFEFAALLFYCFVLHYYLARYDPAHWPVIPIVAVLVLLSIAIEMPWQPAVSPVAAIVILGAAIFALVLTPSLRPHISDASVGIDILAGLEFTTGKSDTDLVVDTTEPIPEWTALYDDQNELEAIRYLRQHTSSTEPIFVGTADHSRIFYNDMRIYWLADRPIGVRTFQLETGMATEAAVQREIILDLTKSRVRWVILELARQHGDATFERRAYQGSTLLDRYIRENFQSVTRFGEYGVVTRR